MNPSTNLLMGMLLVGWAGAWRFLETDLFVTFHNEKVSITSIISSLVPLHLSKVNWLVIVSQLIKATKTTGDLHHVRESIYSIILLLPVDSF